MQATLCLTHVYVSGCAAEAVVAYILREREFAKLEIPLLPIVSLIVREELEQTFFADVLRRVHGDASPLSEMERRVR